MIVFVVIVISQLINCHQFEELNQNVQQNIKKTLPGIVKDENTTVEEEQRYFTFLNSIEESKPVVRTDFIVTYNFC